MICDMATVAWWIATKKHVVCNSFHTCNFFLCLLGQLHSCPLPIHFQVLSHQQCGWALKRAPRAWQETIHSSVASLHCLGPLKPPSVRMEGTSESWLLAAQPVSASSEPFRPLPGHCRTVSKAISHCWWKPEQSRRSTNTGDLHL